MTISNPIMLQIIDRLARIEALMQTEAERCPYRESIKQSGNSVGKLETLESVVVNMRLEMAKAGLLGGGVGGSIAMGMFTLGKVLKWW